MFDLFDFTPVNYDPFQRASFLVPPANDEVKSEVHQLSPGAESMEEEHRMMEEGRGAGVAISPEMFGGGLREAPPLPANTNLGMQEPTPTYPPMPEGFSSSYGKPTYNAPGEDPTAVAREHLKALQEGKIKFGAPFLRKLPIDKEIEEAEGIAKMQEYMRNRPSPIQGQVTPSSLPHITYNYPGASLHYGLTGPFRDRPLPGRTANRNWLMPSGGDNE